MSQEESQTHPAQDSLIFLRSNTRTIISVVIGLVVVALIIVIVLNIIKGSAPFKPTQKAVLGSHTFKVKVAQSEKEKEIGLSATKNLPNDYGMIFPFKEDGYYSFWMRDMKFPIDIIFINDNKIVKIFQKISPPKGNEALKIYVPDAPSDTVLEINSGLSEKYKIKEGNSIKLSDL